MKYWIIESSVHGVYVGTECYGNGKYWDTPRPRWRWSIPRSQGQIFYSREGAEVQLKDIKQSIFDAHIIEMSA